MRDRFTYNGKELQGTLNYLDYGARMYDATIGRWGVVDNLADEPEQLDLTVYNSFWNNPINYNDPDGNCPSCPQGDEAAKVYAPGANVINKDGMWQWDGKKWTGTGLEKTDNGTVDAYVPDKADRWREGNFFQKLAYGIADGVYSIFANHHLGGKGFDGYDDKMKTKLGGLVTLGGPLLSGGSVGVNMVNNAATKSSRVFWSGGNIAKNAAMDFAKANGMKTLEMTIKGRVMNSITPYLPRSVTTPIWDKLSADFAKGAIGDVNVFQNAAGVGLRSTWRRIEYPILKNKNNSILYHTVN